MDKPDLLPVVPIPFVWSRKDGQPLSSIYLRHFQCPEQHEDIAKKLKNIWFAYRQKNKTEKWGTTKDLILCATEENPNVAEAVLSDYDVGRMLLGGTTVRVKLDSACPPQFLNYDSEHEYTYTMHVRVTKDRKRKRDSEGGELSGSGDGSTPNQMEENVEPLNSAT